jgi:succinoglycan biosynthesis protein ExoU
MDVDGTVAIVIACHDSARFIGRAIRSALAQPEATEVIVVDDASTDGSEEAAHAADDGSGRLLVLRQPVNRGPAATRNRGMAAARSAWLAILDADDFILPGRLAGMLRHAPDADIVADDPLRVREESIDGPQEVVLGITTPRWITFAEFVTANIARPGRGWLRPISRRCVVMRQTSSAACNGGGCMIRSPRENGCGRRPALRSRGRFPCTCCG